MKKSLPQKSYLDTRIVLRRRDKDLADYIKRECARTRLTPSKQVIYMLDQFYVSQAIPKEIQ